MEQFHRHELGISGELSYTCPTCGRSATVKESDLGEGWRDKANVSVTHEDSRFGVSHKVSLNVADLIKNNEVSFRP